MADLRKIDALVAEHVMDREIVWKDLDVRPKLFVDGGPATEEMPFYSSDIAAAWEVVEKLPDYDLKRRYGKWACTSLGDDCVWELDLPPGISDLTKLGAVADTAPLAICLAALKARGVEVEE